MIFRTLQFEHIKVLCRFYFELMSFKLLLSSDIFFAYVEADYHCIFHGHQNMADWENRTLLFMRGFGFAKYADIYHNR